LLSEELNKGLQEGVDLYREFNCFNPSQVVWVKHQRVIPPIVTELGELVGLIYRSDKWQQGQPSVFIHLMKDPPKLVSNVKGTQLYIVGGTYRVTPRGIEG
jgi:hypothetical protein